MLVQQTPFPLLKELQELREWKKIEFMETLELFSDPLAFTKAVAVLRNIEFFVG